MRNTVHELQQYEFKRLVAPLFQRPAGRRFYQDLNPVQPGFQKFFDIGAEAGEHVLRPSREFAVDTDFAKRVN